MGISSLAKVLKQSYIRPRNIQDTKLHFDSVEGKSFRMTLRCNWNSITWTNFYWSPKQFIPVSCFRARGTRERVNETGNREIKSERERDGIRSERRIAPRIPDLRIRARGLSQLDITSWLFLGNVVDERARTFLAGVYLRDHHELTNSSTNNESYIRLYVYESCVCDCVRGLRIVQPLHTTSCIHKY